MTAKPLKLDGKYWNEQALELEREVEQLKADITFRNEQLRVAKRIIAKPLVVNPLRRLGFMNYYYPMRYGFQKDRLVLKGKAGLNNTLFNVGGGTITIGEDVIFGHNCMVLTGKHNTQTAGESGSEQDGSPKGSVGRLTHSQQIVVCEGQTAHLNSDAALNATTTISGSIWDCLEGNDITIGDNTWIASGAIILASVGRNCVIAAGAVVTKDIPDNSFAAGVPAKIVKR